MERNDHHGPITTLIVVIGQAARAGWPQTARLIVLLLAVAHAAGALVVTTSR